MKKVVFSLAILLFAVNIYSQISGIKSIPGDYPTIKSALDAINSTGVGTGGVTFNVAAENAEYSSLCSLKTSTSSASNPIIFQKSGAGINPVIYTGSAGTNTSTDGIIKIIGTSYVTFDGIDLVDTNTVSPTTQMEWGFALLKSRTDTSGCRNVVIKNSHITFRKKLGGVFSTGIYSGNNFSNSATSITLSPDYGRLTQTNSFNKFYGNTIDSAVNGIYLTGFIAASPYNLYDSQNEIGGDAGNIINNYGSAMSSDGIIALSQDSLKIFNNSVTSVSGSSGLMRGITTNYGINSNLEIYNNTISINSVSTSFNFYGIYNNIGAEGTTNRIKIYNNKILNCSSATIQNYSLIINLANAQDVEIYGNEIKNNLNTGAAFWNLLNQTGDVKDSVIIYNNTISNNKSTATGNVIFIVSTPTAATTTLIYGNNIDSNSAVTASKLYGIYSYDGIKNLIYGNNIRYDSTSGNTIYGIYHSNPNSSNTGNIFGNNVNNLSNSGTNGYVNGIFSGSNASGSVLNIYNNFVSELNSPLTGNNSVVGICDSTTDANTSIGIYYNTVYLNASAGNNYFGSIGLLAVSSSTSTNGLLDMRNNIIVNVSTPGIYGNTYGYRRSDYNFANYAITSDNNCYYAGDGSNRFLYSDGSYNLNTVDSVFKARLYPRDQNSFKENPAFTNITSSPYDLHIPDLTSSLCESGAQRITSPALATDFDNDLRWGETGYSGSGIASDVGADEFGGVMAMVYDSSNVYQVSGAAFLGVDNQAIIRIEIMTHRPGSYLNVTNFVVNANGTYNISDINSSTAKIYYTGTSSVFDTTTFYGYATPTIANFNIGGSQILAEGRNYFWLTYYVSPGAAIGNWIDGECKYITINSVAQIPKVTAPSGFKVISGPMHGAYFVGAGYSYPHFPTLTEAASNLNNRGINSSVLLLLNNDISAPYNSTNGEVFPIEFNSITGASSSNKIKIRPYTGRSCLISGSASSVLKLYGTDYLTIDGSNNGSASKDLTIQNTSTSSSTTAVHFYSNLSTLLGCIWDTLKNCNISAGTNTTTSTGISISGSGITSVGVNNDFITIQNNNIYKCYYGIYAGGATGGNPNKYDYLNIIGNKIGSANATEYVTNYGIYLSGSANTGITGNDIFNLINNSSKYGIYISDNVTNSVFRKNKIHGFSQTNTNSGYSCYGMYFYPTNPTSISNNIIDNNVIYDLYNYGSTSLNSFAGISLRGGNTYSIYYNSISMTGTYGSSTANCVNSCLNTQAAISTIDLRNNIFYNSYSGNSPKSYTLITYPGSSFSNINYNDYYTTGSYFGRYNGTECADFTSWRTASGSDANSKNINPEFQSAADIRPSLISGILASGTPISGYTTDILDTARSASYPSMGAYEKGADALGPVISYSVLGNTTSLADRILSAVSLTDVSGVNFTTGTAPRIYYKKTTETNTYTGNTSADNGWKWTETSTGFSPADFTIDYSLLNSTAVMGDTIQYFIVAQDIQTSAYVNINSGTPARTLASVSLSADDFPITGTINKYILKGTPLSGVYNVGLSAFNKHTGKNLYHKFFTRKVEMQKEIYYDSIIIEETDQENIKHKYETNTANETYSVIYEGNRPYSGPAVVYSDEKIFKAGSDAPNGVYTSLGSALASLSDRTVGGPVIFSLTDADYPSETFPITLTTVTGMSFINTVTIQPDTSVVTRITSANTNGLFVLDGAQYFVIDGSDPVNSVNKNLLLVNTNTTSSVIKLVNASKNNIIRNNQILGFNTNSSNALLLFSTSTGSSGNDSNLIENNFFRDSMNYSTTPYAGIYSYGTSGKNNSFNILRGNQFFNFSTYGICLSSYSGNDWVIKGNHFYCDRVVSSTVTLYNIYINANSYSSGDSILNNYIGGRGPYCTGGNWVKAGLSSFFGIYGRFNTDNLSYIEGNVIKNISLTSTGGANILCIYTNTGFVDIGTVQGNTIDSITTSGTSDCYGIYSLVTSNIANNIIQNIRATSTSNVPWVYGIVMSSTGSMNCYNNQIYYIGFNTGAVAPGTKSAIGIYQASSNCSVYNNVISLGADGQSHNILLYGIYIAGTGTYNNYYNSVNISGTASPGNTRISSALYKYSTGTLITKNNIFNNQRMNGSGGTASNYAYYASDTSNISSDYNDLFSLDSNTTGYFAGNRTFWNWQSFTGEDFNSYSGVPGFISNLNLMPDTTNVNCWNVFGKGLQLATVNKDIRGLPRSTVIVNGPTCFGAYEFTPSVVPPIATPSGSPSSGGTSSYSQSGRNLLDITWGSNDNYQLSIINDQYKKKPLSETYKGDFASPRNRSIYAPDALPTTVDVQYYSGITPPDTLGIPSPKMSKGYWKVDADRDPSQPVNVKIYYGDHELGDISDTSKLILAMYDMKNRVWVPFARGFSGNGVSIRDNANNIITVNGLTRMDSVCFALTQSDAPLKRLNINFTCLISGFYRDNGTGTYVMRPDTIIVVIRDTVGPNYAPVETIRMLQSDSLGHCNGFTSLANAGGYGYYLQVIHLNSLDTWTPSGPLGQVFSNLTGVMTFDFSTAQTQAYGNNLIQAGDGKWCIINGDCNQDGYIDGSDYLEVINHYDESGYLAGDNNGDDYVDGSDYLSIINNYDSGVITPSGMKMNPMNKTFIRTQKYFQDTKEILKNKIREKVEK